MRDAAPYLDAAFESIAAQSFRDWEWLVADDASRDDGAAKLAGWARRDPRIRVQSGGGGMIGLVNAALDEARGELIARMDADDLAHEERLAEQVAFLERNPRTSIVDSRVECFDSPPGLGEGMRHYVAWANGLAETERGGGESHRAIERDFFVESPVIQPAALVRRSALREVGGYRDGDFPEDYDLWLRLLLRGRRFAKLPRTLLRWRDPATRLTRTHSRYRAGAFFEAKKLALWEYESERMRHGPLAVWGAGGRGRPWRRFLREKRITPAFFIEVDPRKLGRTILRAPILPPDALAERSWSYLLVVVAARGAREEIRSHLIAKRFLRPDGSPAPGRQVRFVQ